MENQSSRRLLTLFIRLLQGEKFDETSWRALALTAESKSKRVYQRDLMIIKETLADCHDGHRLVLNGKQHQLRGQTDPHGLTYTIALAHILLASRAFTQKEVDGILGFLKANLTPATQDDYTAAIKADRNSYQPLSKRQPVLSRLVTLTNAIANYQMLTFHYRNGATQKQRAYQAQPVALYFATYYFYVSVKLAQHDDFALFRVDRMTSIDFSAPGDARRNADHFSLPDQRSLVHLLPMGQLTTFRFKCWLNPQNVLDQFPSAHKVAASVERNGVLIEAQAKEAGALLWLQSQGPNVQVVSPPQLIKKLKRNLAQTAALYD
ncbi:WYL domain-containing protein [Loigolactobacillus zhaoyuanensis]|uniref:WYL domain-containing protein n=1 Tax=Loigolactobacillus zhaoyuanensis TaxID=2486017 RepID=A0ABW8U882_9LACO